MSQCFSFKILIIVYYYVLRHTYTSVLLKLIRLRDVSVIQDKSAENVVTNCENDVRKH